MQIMDAINALIELAEQGEAEAQNILGKCYYYGNGVEQNYEKAVKYFKMAAEQGRVNLLEPSEYYVEIFENLKGRTIQVINDISEPIREDVGAVLIMPKENEFEHSHTLYDIETYKRIKTRVNEILEDIEELNQDRSNEFDIFMKIYLKLGKMIAYDYEETNQKVKRYTARNLIGGLLEGKCVCARICRNIKKCTCM